MRRNRLMAVISLAGLCLFAPTMVAKAETTNTITDDNGSYTVTIPTDVSIDSNSKSADFTVSAELKSYKKLDISIASDNKYQLKCGDNYGLKYTLTDSNEEKIEQIVYSTQTGTPQTFSTTLKATLTDSAKVSGIYSDTLRFTMKCQECYPEGKVGLTFDANGGVADTDRKVLDIGEAYGELPTASRTGYTFDGWYTEINAGQPVTEASKLTQNTTVYAHWTANTYHVVYDNNAKVHTQASGEMEASTMTYGSKQCLKKSEIQNGDSGARFIGWNTKADGTGTAYTDEQEVLNLTSEVNGLVTLYAQWEYENIVEVRFEDVNGNMDRDKRNVIDEWFSAGNKVSWSIQELTEYRNNEKSWNHQWKVAENSDDSVQYTTNNASKTTTVDIKRQMYYLDLNAQWYDSKGKLVSPGGGNLKWGDTVTATATVAINGGDPQSSNDGTDYFVQQRYGSSFTITVTMKPGYKLIGVYTGPEQPLCDAKIDYETNTVTGIVTGEREIRNSTGVVKDYDATTIALMIQKESSDGTTTSDSEEKESDVNIINSDASVNTQNIIWYDDVQVEESETETAVETEKQESDF